MESDLLLMDDLSTARLEPRRRTMGTNGRKILGHYSIGNSSDEELLDIGRPANGMNEERVPGNA